MGGITGDQSEFAGCTCAEHRNVIGLDHFFLYDGIVKTLSSVQDIDGVASFQAVKVAKEGVTMACDHGVATAAWNRRSRHVARA